MKDVQNYIDKRDIEIEEVGIKKIILPFLVPDRTQGKQRVISEVKVGVSLKGECKGAHMSRFVSIMNGYKKKVLKYPIILEILSQLRKSLKTKFASFEAYFFYFIEKKSPISSEKSLMGYKSGIIANVKEGEREQVFFRVFVPISSVCPCSLAISEVGAHNQRGLVDLRVKVNKFVWFEDLISTIEKYGGSGEVYPLLKRTDEKYVTEKMFSNPKFAEDIVRDIAIRLKKKKEIESFLVECTNFESIHPHEVYAKIKN